MLRARPGGTWQPPQTQSTFLSPAGWVRTVGFTDLEPVTQKVTDLPPGTQPPIQEWI